MFLVMLSTKRKVRDTAERNVLLISVIIPTMGAKSLEKTLESLRKQSTNCEAIIVDGSGTAKSILRKFEDQRSSGSEKHSVFRCTYVKESIGTRAGACNVGIAKAKGDIIVTTDDDCTFPENWLKKIQDFFKSNPDIDVYGGNDIIKNPTFFQQTLFLIDEYNEKKTKKPEDRLRGCNTAYRKKVFEKHLFDEKQTGLEETELHHRLKKNFHLVYDPELIVYHERRRNFRQLAKRFYTNGTARFRLIRKTRKPEPMDIAPFAGVLVSIISFFISLLHLWLFLIIIYFLAKTIIIGRHAKYFALLFPILIIRELSFSIGMLRALVKR
jgi:glycosyltransferase involved in cell wall biosynthesis